MIIHEFLFLLKEITDDARDRQMNVCGATQHVFAFIRDIIIYSQYIIYKTISQYKFYTIQNRIKFFSKKD
ncbi:hypothetical protein AMS61_00225 [Bacillus sp. FJAT-21351]|nr:hypothetical protein AMS61_00225 [Bacillus sp. FJAT-21351]